MYTHICTCAHRRPVNIGYILLLVGLHTDTLVATQPFQQHTVRYTQLHANCAQPINIVAGHTKVNIT